MTGNPLVDDAPSEPCGACEHPDRDSLEGDLPRDTRNVARYAERYGISPRDVRRHRRRHLPAEAVLEALDRRDAPVRARLDQLREDARRRGLDV